MTETSAAVRRNLGDYDFPWSVLLVLLACVLFSLYLYKTVKMNRDVKVTNGTFLQIRRLVSVMYLISVSNLPVSP